MHFVCMQQVDFSFLNYFMPRISCYAKGAGLPAPSLGVPANSLLPCPCIIVCHQTCSSNGRLQSYFRESLSQACDKHSRQINISVSSLGSMAASVPSVHIQCSSWMIRTPNPSEGCSAEAYQTSNLFYDAPTRHQKIQ